MVAMCATAIGNAVFSAMKPYYEDKAVTIYHGDCKDVLPDILKVDLILTDPPYGIGAYADGYMGGGVMAKQSRFNATTWDDKPADIALVKHIITRGRKVIIWGGNYLELPASRCWLVWDKVNGQNNFADCELAWTNLDMSVRIIHHKWQGMLQQNMKEKEVRLHPTQKPTPVMAWCINLSGDVRTILDPFMGSGSTLRAAKDLRKKAIGIEVNESYCEIAAKRMAQEILL